MSVGTYYSPSCVLWSITLESARKGEPMQEKRRFPRFACLLKTRFSYALEIPDSEDSQPRYKKSHGRILDISCGGVFIATNAKCGLNVPLTITFKTERRVYVCIGSIVRTGLLKNNPSDAARKYKGLKIRENGYIAVEFDTPLQDLEVHDL